MNPDFLITLNSVHSLIKIKNGIVFGVDDELAELLFFNNSMVRLRVSQGGIFEEKPSISCIDADWPGAEFSVDEDDNAINLKADELHIKVCKRNFAVFIDRHDGGSILKPRKDVPFYQFQNNHFVVSRDCSPNEHIYGLGEKTGFLDHHGRKLTMWNTDVLAPDPDKSIEELLAGKDKNPLDTDFDPYYMSIPFFYRMNSENLNASGHFIDNPYKGEFEFNNGKNDSHIQIHFNGGQYCEYFFAGPSIPNILQDYTELTGRIEAPPIWSLGYHQCRWKKYSHEDLLELAEKQRHSQVPCDVLWLDIDYMDEYRVFTWNDELFPDHKSLFKKLEGMGFRVITIVDPGIKYEKGYEIFDHAKKNNLLCKCENGQIYVGQVWPGKTAFPDFSKADCRDWWGKLNATHINDNIAGIWNDMNEPATGSISNQSMRFAGDDNGSHPHERYHNEYATLMAAATVEGLKEDQPEKRTFVLSRAGSPGIQRYAANWMGDNASRWEHLQMSLPMAMNLGLSGQPFVGGDIGGFVEPTHAELFIRWMQCGALTPFCRNHNDDTVDQYVWSFGEGVREKCQKAIEMRYKLLPYIYTQFIKSTETGTPIQRPLVYDFQSDPAVKQIDDQYMFGDSILVAPVLHKGAAQRHLYLPEGEWYSCHEDQTYKGQQWITVSAPIDTIPVFYLCGKVIPMLTDIPQATMNLQPNILTLFLALPSTSGTWTSYLCEDDGLTTKRDDDQCLDTKFTVKSTKSGVLLESSTTGEGFPEFKRHKFNLILAADKHIKSLKKSLKKGNNGYVLNNQGEALNIEFIK